MSLLLLKDCEKCGFVTLSSGQRLFTTADYTKFMVIGGWSKDVFGYHNGTLNRTEIFNLENASTTCNMSDYPVRQTGMAVGIMQEIIKSCGGQSSPHDVCYNYYPANDTWVKSSNMTTGRYYHGSSFIDSVWLLSNGGSSSTESTMEKWTGTAFELGPSLPRKMFGHCQLTVDAAHVFFADPDGQPNYLLNWAYQTWTELPPMATRMREHSCGLINNPKMGREAVVVGFGKTEIFNFDSHTWRFGRDAPYFYTAGYAQLLDTFVVVGGFGRYDYGTLDAIYKFDNINYEWTELGHRLETPCAMYPGVVAVPDRFVNCT